MDIYVDVINYLKKDEKHLLKKTNHRNLERHHIIPFHQGGFKEGPVILCTSRNHALAHYYRYLDYKQKGDFVAFTMRSNQRIGSSERAFLAVKKNKLVGNLFWDSKWQAKQGKKGGQKSGRKKLFQTNKEKSCGKL